MKIISEGTITVPKTRKEYNDTDRKAIEKNFRAKKIVVGSIGLEEYNRISTCQSTKEIWEALQTAHEGTTQVKQSKIDMLTTEYELFKMKEDESIHDMHTRFTCIINELHSLETIILRNKLMKKKKDLERREPKKENILVLKAENSDSSGYDTNMAYLTQRFQKMKEHNKYNAEKAVKRNSVADRNFKRRNVADNVVKQALATWGDFSSESDGDDEQGDTSVMAIESKAREYDSIFVPMAKYDEDEVDDEDEVEEGAQTPVAGSLEQRVQVDQVLEVIPVQQVVLVLPEVRAAASAGSSSGSRDFDSLNGSDLICRSVVDDDVELWHRRLGRESFTLLNKLIKKDLVRGLPKSKFNDHKICDACVKVKQVSSSFKPKKEVSTSRPLDLLHTDLCGPMRMPNRGGKKYNFVIVNDYSRFTRTLFLRTKDETFPVFIAFVKQIQVKMSHNVVSIRSNHDTEFDNAKFDELCAENGISHNFSAPRTLPTKWYCGEEK
ncbi:uncharacterized protein [Nicotiana tomentosiformis]|uniref:uncharacterized protein n=1 Tax=Nicotiana tomentosiformis TaxID=4098 RepID=UPI00388CB587